MEHSTNGKDFALIGEVKGNGSTESINDYSYIVKEPYPGINYFRLKQIDFDGQYEYSSIVNANINDHDAIAVFPNPVSNDNLNINLTTNDEGNVDIIIIDATGKLIQSTQKQIYAGSNQLAIDVSVIPSGFYQIVMKAPNKTFVTNFLLKK